MNVLEWGLWEEGPTSGLLKLSHVYKSPIKMCILTQQVSWGAQGPTFFKAPGGTSAAGPDIESRGSSLATPLRLRPVKEEKVR